ncbi:MAG TPA: hypothetical protein VH092_37140 [Urbifossiella sp.]|nr:hypothetical protein [Urbifossiella sp.]
MIRFVGPVTVLALFVTVSPVRPADPPADGSAAVVAGKVLPLATALAKTGLKADADMPGVALVTDEGRVYPLVKEELSRLLFAEEKLQNRPVRLTAKLVPGTTFLRVTGVQTVKDGKVYDVDYFCDNCQLPALSPGPCKCCGGPTYLRETLVK